MSFVCNAINLDADIPLPLNTPRNLPLKCTRARENLPNKIPCLWIVVKQFFKSLLRKLFSQFTSSMHVTILSSNCTTRIQRDS